MFLLICLFHLLFPIHCMISCSVASEELMIMSGRSDVLQCAVGTFCPGQLSTAIQRGGLAPCFSMYLVFLSSFPKTDGLYGGTVGFAGIYGYSFTISNCPEHFKITNYTINLLSVFPIFCYYSGIMDFVFGT